MSRIGRLLREQRRAHGWTQDELARATGVDQQAISRIETGGTRPEGAGADVLRRLAKQLGIDGESLLLVLAADMMGYEIAPDVARAALSLQKLPQAERDALIKQIAEAVAASRVIGG